MASLILLGIGGVIAVTMGVWALIGRAGHGDDGPDLGTISGQWIAERLSGTYTCMQSGKTVRPGLEVTLGIVESTSQETAATTLERVGTFLTSE